ncbi:hypothetical protein KEM55_004360, partial [Ascosphaera atra]
VRHPTVHSLTFQYGGTDIYSAYEGDFSEAASILRKLSRATYCLKWLDLEGCSEWIAALVFTPPDQAKGSTGPEWNASWRGIEWLSLGPGWRPGDLREMSDDEMREARKELEKYDGLVQGARSIGKQIQGPFKSSLFSLKFTSNPSISVAGLFTHSRLRRLSRLTVKNEVHELASPNLGSESPTANMPLP